MGAHVEDGKIVYTTDNRSRTSRSPYDARGNVVCGADNQSGGTCGRPAGTGTDHKGVGRCFLHNGRSQTMAGIMKKEGLAATINFPNVKEEFDRLQTNQDVFDLRDHIHLIEAIALTVMKNAKTSNDLPLVAKLVRDAAKTIKELDEIEHGRRLVIDVQGVNVIFAQVKEVIFRHIPDSYTRDLIARDITEIYSDGASSTNQPVPGRRLLESGMAVEG